MFIRTCKYYIYDHTNYLKERKRQGQKVVYLTHGCGFKAPTIGTKCYADEVYAVSPLYYKPMALFSGSDENLFLDMGYPRIDYFFRPINKLQIAFKNKYRFNDFKKIFLWMPTFRRSKNVLFDEDYFESETGLPILYGEKELDE